VRLRAIATPGHTPESISIAAYDLEKSDRAPHAVLTGDALFLGDVGRPDLLVSVGMTADQLAGMLYDSLHDKLLRLPDATLVYPAHGAGSMCGKNMSTDRVSTLGVQRRSNYALQAMSRRQFIELLTADQPQAPRYFAFDAQQNRKLRPTLEENLARTLKPLALPDLLRLANTGAMILDTREPPDFAAVHLVGSVNIGLSGRFETWAGTLLDPATNLVLITPPGKEMESALRLGRIGYDRIQGYLENGAAALASRADLSGRTSRIEPHELKRELEQPGSRPFVLDVRTETEWRDRHLEGSVNIPLAHLPDRLREVPSDRRVVIHCQSGYRSAIAASLLKRRGLTQLSDVVGGIAAWEAAKLPVVK
jgi:rhodanese-related sulfurtransferase